LISERACRPPFGSAKPKPRERARWLYRQWGNGACWVFCFAHLDAIGVQGAIPEVMAIAEIQLGTIQRIGGTLREYLGDILARVHLMPVRNHLLIEFDHIVGHEPTSTDEARRRRP